MVAEMMLEGEIDVYVEHDVEEPEVALHLIEGPPANDGENGQQGENGEQAENADNNDGNGGEPALSTDTARKNPKTKAVNPTHESQIASSRGKDKIVRNTYRAATMPTVSVGRDRLFAALGKTYTREEFEDLCFRFGIELDDVTTEKAIILKEKHLEKEQPSADDEVIYKIEVPANRYDLLCLEGLAQALCIFNGQDEIPRYKVANISKESMLKMCIKKETSPIRPFVVCAVLRGITFDEASYNSFIDLQDKLHQNICRAEVNSIITELFKRVGHDNEIQLQWKRTLVAIGTHDLDTLQGPFTYEALPPPEINFVPLKQVKNFRADELMEFYKSDLKLKKFLHIIEKSNLFPVIYDRNRTVLSLPPIINGAHSAITLKTKNVFIECTATDLTKAKIVLNTMVTTFSAYCERKFEVEPVEVIDADGKSSIYPDLSEYKMEVPLSYITGTVGVPLEVDEVTSLLNRMQLQANRGGLGDTINVSVPPTRSDILHACDVMERKLSSLKPLPLNELSDLIRYEIAMNGFTEVLTWILCSKKEIFEMLNRRDDKSSAVIIANPRSSDFEVVRTSLMPGMLKTVGHNKDHPKPIKRNPFIDGLPQSNPFCPIVLLDEKKDVGASNRRLLAALYCGANSGFELIHGLVDRVMEVMGTPFVPVGDNTGYYIQLSDEPEFLTGRQAKIIYKGRRIGIFGIVHPEVLNNFDIPDPCSFLEIYIENFCHHVE
ncbi:Phenylalanyl-tRNA synthetase, class IIc, beta subunit, archae/euk cytosolic [Corchorus olitorius]|uniref:phenylalanine--tRNA ligase n=1 Tax=Corchorus olitorius TaxID=93759 RepID=A0A1R3HHU4_9ROSI|nr:Phenylalanyl-tRNA synthetase, class IIc, beta subunit, archae/euk cytosolic [Corchorus olitorius]